MSIDEHRILVLIEKEEEHILPLTFELLKAGKKLADKGGEALCACIVGHQLSALADELSYYADEVYVLDAPLLAAFQADLYTAALVNLCRKLNPATFLMGHTYESMELAPRLAYRIGSTLITNCIGLEREMETGNLICTKLIYGGNAVANFLVDTKPQMLTLSSRVMDALEKGEKKGKIVPFDCSIETSRALTESLRMVSEPGESVSLDKADVIVSCGRGVKDTKGIEIVSDLVKTFRKFYDKVELGSSRPLVDAGLLPRSRQVGLTGEKVSPQLYIACAISGASQHLNGIAASQKIIAINNNQHATIFDFADYGIVGRYEDIVPALIQELEELV